jgi:uncharacterized protein YjbJ (UPF0337 family)
METGIRPHLTQEGDSMTTDELQGKWMHFKGGLEEKYGKFTDHDLQQIESIFGKFVSNAQERSDKKQNDLMRWAGRAASIVGAGTH